MLNMSFTVIRMIIRITPNISSNARDDTHEAYGTYCTISLSYLHLELEDSFVTLLSSMTILISHYS